MRVPLAPRALPQAWPVFFSLSALVVALIFPALWAVPDYSFFFLWPHCEACKISVSRPGIEREPWQGKPGILATRPLLRVSQTTRRLNCSILKEINPEYSLEGIFYQWAKIQKETKAWGWLFPQIMSWVWHVHHCLRPKEGSPWVSRTLSLRNAFWLPQAETRGQNAGLSSAHRRWGTHEAER